MTVNRIDGFAIPDPLEDGRWIVALLRADGTWDCLLLVLLADLVVRLGGMFEADASSRDGGYVEGFGSVSKGYKAKP